MYNILEKAQEAPQKANGFVEFVKTQPVLFAVGIIAVISLVAVGLIALKVMQNKKTRK